MDVSSWKEYKLTEVFPEMYHGKRLVKSKRIPGDIPFITAGYKNNGIAEFIGNDEQESFKNAITVDMFGNTFYRDYEFKCDDNILVLKNSELDNETGIFLCTVMNQWENTKYGYGFQFRQKDFRRESIILPSNKNSQPDWNYMRSFIKSRPFSKRL